MPDPHARVDRRIGLLGDPHGDLHWTVRAIDALVAAGVRQIHVLGDFGFVWHGGAAEQLNLAWVTHALAEGKAHMYVTEGNHEGYQALERLYPRDARGYRHLSDRITWLPRGWRGRTEQGTVVASLGGANSIDRDQRRPAVRGRDGTWWPEEQITEADLAALGRNHASILLAHDAPITKELASRLEATRGHWTPEGIAYAETGQRMFQRAVMQVRPRLVVSGHYHLYLETKETFQEIEQPGFDVRSVILDCNGRPGSIATLDTTFSNVEVLPR